MAPPDPAAMLNTLRIKNLALVTDLTLELRPGYNAISGETGAGKSIILGALNLVLGERADRTLIRDGCDQCSVEAVFDIARLKTPLEPFLEENGLEPSEHGQLFLKRTFTSSGTNRQFVNGSPTSLKALALLGRVLVDIHGPHDHQSLLYPAEQLAILDAYGQLENSRREFGELLRCRTGLEEEKQLLVVDEQTYAQQLDLLRFQATEIEAAGLNPDAEAELDAEYRRSSNAAQILQLTQASLALLGEDDPSLLNLSGSLGRLLSELARFDPETASITEAHNELMNVASDLQTRISHYQDRLEMDPERHGQLEERINLVQSLKRKYGPALADVITFGEQARTKLEALEGREAELVRINREIEQTNAQLDLKGRALSLARSKLAPKLTRAITKELEQLGFAQSRFDVDLSSRKSISEFGSQGPGSGFDTIEFQFAPNKGEAARSLRSIASSGELARVMLALKTVLAAQDAVPVLLFDEVDANVGGETARIVGKKMRQIARDRQVLCITHLAPVAAAADSHYVVTKQVTDARTHSDIQLVTGKARITELARMLGGVSREALKHAASLLEETE